MPKKNIPLLKRLQARFLRMRHKKHFDMKVLAAQTDCGAAMCMIGHLLDLSGYKMRLKKKLDARGFLDFDFIKPNGRMLRRGPQVEAERLVGLNRHEANNLFMDLSLKTPKQAAKRIERLIAEG